MIDATFIALQQALAGEYSIERELGRGGMGIVYLAREVQLDRLVAIKVLPEALAARVDVRDRFLREARLSASLSHPHIVPIYRVGEAGGFVFFAMAYVPGETLGERLRVHGPMAAPAAARLLREVAWGLAYAHGRGIVHRDVKPDNILIEAETGRAVVTDFGIARGSEDVELTDPARIMGTAQFMSPEQAANERLDGRSDLYSLSVVGYLALSGTFPFNVPSVPALVAKQATEPAPPLATRVVSVPRALAMAIDRCLRRNPDERFATGEALAEALDTVTSPERSRLPVALRTWVKAKDPLIPAYMLWSGIFSIATLNAFTERHPVGRYLLLALSPLAPLSIFHLRRTYQVLAKGYTLRDLRAALAAWRNERREELAFEGEEDEGHLVHFVRAATYLSLGGFAIVLLFDWMRPTPIVMDDMMRWLTIGSFMAAAGTLLVSNSLGVRLVARELRQGMVGFMRSAILNSPFGEWVVNKLQPRARRLDADVEFRPTEMALGVAADELYAALPLAYREDLPDLPAVVRRLEAYAANARAREDRGQLAEAVSALESLRLDLLRLHAGDTDLRPITTVLEAAREVGEQVDRLGKAQLEVDNAREPTPV